MQDLVERYLAQLLEGTLGEGKRRLTLKAISMAIDALRGVRRLLMLQYTLMIACFLWAMSFFATGWMIAERWENSPLALTPPFVFSTGLLGAVTAVLLISVNDWLWIRATGLQKKKDELVRAGRKSEGNGGMSREEMALMIGQVIEAKLDRALDERLRSAAREERAAQAQAEDQAERKGA